MDQGTSSAEQGLPNLAPRVDYTTKVRPNAEFSRTPKATFRRRGTLCPECVLWRHCRYSANGGFRIDLRHQISTYPLPPHAAFMQFSHGLIEIKAARP
jgi:hypothetical protein